MSFPTRRSRARAATERDIRRTARVLLARHGPDAVTLRAIARSLGITAPALYRYHTSRDDLLEVLRRDIAADLGVELGKQIAELPGDGAVRLFAICNGFRQWALQHTHEFTLVFASPSTRTSTDTLHRLDEPFSRIFLAAAGRVIAGYDLAKPDTATIPSELRNDLCAFHSDLLAVVLSEEPEFPTHKLDLSVMYLMIQFWARLYGHVALEVFGNYPIPLSTPNALFNAAMADLARETGLTR